MFILPTLVACQPESPLDTPLEGRIIFWHSWPEEQAVYLQAAIDNFVELNPGISVAVISQNPDELLTQYIDTVNEGLGADLFIGSSEWTNQLASANQIRPLGDRELPESTLSPVVRDTVTFNEQLYGLPLFIYPNALYLNRNLVDKRPLNLDNLLNQAAAGLQVAFVPRFQEAHWGIQTFGEGLFDDQGVFTLDSSGFTEWLTWLDRAQSEPGVILNIDRDGLVDLFVKGELAYFVGDPDMLTAFKQQMDPDSFAVTLLPSGPAGPAGPLLSAEAIFYNPASSENQKDIAAALARYLFSPQQSINLMRQTDRIPANSAVTVDSRIYPEISGFAAQARTAATLPNELPLEQIYQIGDQAYSSVLSGVATPEEATCRFGQRVVQLQDYDSESYRLPIGCELKLPAEEP